MQDDILMPNLTVFESMMVLYLFYFYTLNFLLFISFKMNNLNDKIFF